jgi:hypothetical protein
MLIFSVVGILFAVVRWKRHPKVSLLTLSAFGIYLIDFVVYTGLRYWLPNLILIMKLSDREYTRVLTAVSVLDDFVFAAIIVLLVVAAFTGRRNVITA